MPFVTVIMLQVGLLEPATSKPSEGVLRLVVLAITAVAALAKIVILTRR